MRIYSIFLVSSARHLSLLFERDASATLLRIDMFSRDARAHSHGRLGFNQRLAPTEEKTMAASRLRVNGGDIQL